MKVLQATLRESSSRFLESIYREGRGGRGRERGGWRNDTGGREGIEWMSDLPRRKEWDTKGGEMERGESVFGVDE